MFYTSGAIFKNKRTTRWLIQFNRSYKLQLQNLQNHIYNYKLLIFNLNYDTVH
jgi:hypothetical protein